MTRVVSGFSRIDKWPRLIAASVITIAIGGVALIGRQPAAPTLTSIEVMIPMRDGVKLFTQIYRPSNVTTPLPIVFQRTPYGVGQNTPAGVATALVDLPAVGYIIVLQDIRGRFKSDGSFVMLRQPRDRKDPKAIDESTDTYDTIEWLLKNVPDNNGRVGMVGTSYPAWLAVMGALDPHPALKAIVPMASPADMWLGDDFHHNGAFRLSYGLEYAYMMESSKEITPTSTLIDRYDTYDWYLELGPLSNANRRYFRESLPTWNDFVRHPDYDAFWKRQAFAPWLNRVTVPTLNVAGWWDQEDFYGPIKIYELLEKHDTETGELPRRRTLESWRLVARHRPHARPDRLRQRHRHALPSQRDGHVPRALPEGSGRSAGERSLDVPHRRQRVDPARCLAAREEHDAATLVFPGRRQARLQRAADDERSRLRLVPVRPAQSGSLSPAADHARPRLVDVAGRRSAVRARASGRAHLCDRSAHRAGGRGGADQRASVCRHQRHRQRLGREADRRVSREVLRTRRCADFS